MQCLNHLEGGELTTLSSCICPGHEVAFECVVTGDGATIWNGRALEHCSDDRITLCHSQFNQFGYSLNETCGDSGPIIAHAVSVVNDSYTSQLIIFNVSQSLISANIECSSYSGSIVGTEQILLTTGTFQSTITLHFHHIFYFSTPPTSKQCHTISDQ